MAVGMSGSEARAVAVPEALWREVFAARERLLAVDFDGTLAPFAVEPAAARPLAGSVAALERLAGAATGGAGAGTRVALVSGRPISGLPRELVALPVSLVGEHGWERRAGPFHGADGGAAELVALDPAVAERLRRAAEEAEPLLRPARIERKRTGVVVHTRALDPETARAAERRARELFLRLPADAGLELRPIAGGVELRARGRDKGTALAELAAGFDRAPAIVYLGDDETDEDAFRAARERGGWGVLVGAARPTSARARLDGPAQVAHFLAEWAEREAAARLGP
jgi:trehalose-phosphatase